MNSYHKFKTLTLSLKVDKHSIVHFARKYLPIFVLEHYLFHKAHSFLLELRTRFGTVNGRGQNSQHTFGPKGGSIRSQMTPKCGQNKKEAHEAQQNVADDLLLYRPTATLNLFVYMIKTQNVVNGDVTPSPVLQQTISKTQSRCFYNSAYLMQST